MITVEGYKQVDYTLLNNKIREAWKVSGKQQKDIAKEIGMNTTTFHNTFTKRASDEVVTEVLNAVGLDGFIVLVKGERYYYLKQNN